MSARGIYLGNEKADACGRFRRVYSDLSAGRRVQISHSVSAMSVRVQGQAYVDAGAEGEVAITHVF